MANKKTTKTVAAKKAVEPAAKKVVKTEAVKAEAVETTVTPIEAAAEEVKKVEEKAAKAPAKTKTTKTAATKTTKASKTVETEVIIQYHGIEKTVNDAAAVAKAEFIKQGNKDADIKSVKVYVKPEELAAYCVINDTFEWKVCL